MCTIVVINSYLCSVALWENIYLWYSYLQWYKCLLLILFFWDHGTCTTSKHETKCMYTYMAHICWHVDCDVYSIGFKINAIHVYDNFQLHLVVVPASATRSTSCCPPSEGDNCQATNGDCYCNPICHYYGDCSEDIYCPEGNPLMH